MRGFWMAGVALMLAGCGDSMHREGAAMENAVDDAADNVLEGNATNYQAAVIALSPQQRDVVFIRAINDAGLKCDSVTESTRLKDQNGLPAWRARCSNGGAHMIVITVDGTANIVSRADA